LEGSTSPQEFFPARRRKGTRQQTIAEAMVALGSAGLMALARPNGTGLTDSPAAGFGQELGRGQERGMVGKGHG